MAKTTYIFFPMNDMGVTAIPMLVISTVTEAYQVMGKPLPDIEKEYGSCGVGLWTQDKELERALLNATKLVEDQFLHKIENWTGYRPHQTTTNSMGMKELVHGPLRPE